VQHAAVIEGEQISAFDGKYGPVGIASDQAIESLQRCVDRFDLIERYVERYAFCSPFE